MSDIEKTKALIQSYRDQYFLRKTTLDAGERMRLTRELTDLEGFIRAAVKSDPIPEPVGMPLLNKIADRMIELGFGIFANRILAQHLRHPMSVPFENVDAVRAYIGAHLDDATLAQIPELNSKKKKWGLF